MPLRRRRVHPPDLGGGRPRGDDGTGGAVGRAEIRRRGRVLDGGGKVETGGRLLHAVRLRFLIKEKLKSPNGLLYKVGRRGSRSGNIGRRRLRLEGTKRVREKGGNALRNLSLHGHIMRKSEKGKIGMYLKKIIT